MMKRSVAVLLTIWILILFSACSHDDAPSGAGADGPQDGQAAAGSPAEETAAQPESPVAGRTVAFISGDAEDPFYAAAREGAEKYAGQWGLKLRFADALGQLAAVQQAIDQGVDGICIVPGDASALSAKLKEASAAGITVTTWYSDVPPDARTLTVSQGTAEMLGPMLVEMGVESLKERGVDVTDSVLYAWHASDLSVPDQNAWFEAGRAYIERAYPNWTMAGEAYCSGSDAERAAAVGASIFDEYPDVELIICSDSTALPAQCRAAQGRGLTAEQVTITGFCPRSVMMPYLESGVCTRWGLWDCGMQSAMACYLAAWLSEGNEVHVGDVVNIPRIGSVEILANSELEPEQTTGGANSGVVLLPERVVFTAESVADYNF